jgi:hypothetical protein
MSKKRRFYSKNKEFLVCGEIVCRLDCEVCKQLYNHMS